ncbi:MAG: response regulator [Candidatus Sumerlaeia bacterium]|nr:response regulator [Candidatus Sumerlaeia bacterium]
MINSSMDMTPLPINNANDRMQPFDRGEYQELVYVVDDEEAVCKMLGRFLERSGYQVKTLLSGMEALQQMRIDHPIAMISDIRMPDLDGLDLLSQAILFDPDMVVILMTGAPNMEITIEALRSGATDFLPKPLDMKFLRGALIKGVERRRARMLSQKRQKFLEVEVSKRTRELTDAFMEIQKTYSQIQQAYEGSIELLRRASSLRDNDTGEHIDRIRLYSSALAKAIGLPAEQVQLLESASPMHDIGKIGIPDDILHCPGPLTLEQYELMKQHTIIGHNLLRGYEEPLLKASAEIALTHHERYDGSGYPYGISGEDIPLFGRIVAIVDVWDALTQSRCYKPAFSIDKSTQIMEDQRHKFDPVILSKFFEIIPQLTAIGNSIKVPQP